MKKHDEAGHLAVLFRRFQRQPDDMLELVRRVRAIANDILQGLDLDDAELALTPRQHAAAQLERTCTDVLRAGRIE